MLAVLFWCKPLMVIRRLGIVLRVEQLREGILLRGVGKQSKEHAIHAEIRRDSAGVVLRDG